MNEYYKKALEILKTFHKNGFKAYFVGGYVRDKVIGLNSDDIDITTDALPEQVTELFKKVRNTGEKFGGVTIIEDDFKYEVTTFRLEGAYKNHRHPTEVSFSKKVEDDLARRDFTMNSLIMDHNEIIHNLHGGLEDIHNKIIRTINDPIKRFNEDALRILRAFRFVSKLGFDIEEETLNAISRSASLIKTISIERVMVELDKVFKGKHQKKAIQYMLETGVSKELFGVHNGLSHLATREERTSALEAFIVSFILDDVNDVWRFSNNHSRLIEQVINLHEVTKEDTFNKYIIFSYKLDTCLLSNKISVLLGYKDQQDLILKLHKDMTVHDVCDLAFKGQDILQLTTLKKRSVISLVIDDLLFNVIMGIMPNEYTVLKDFALKRVEELQREMENKNE